MTPRERALLAAAGIASLAVPLLLGSLPWIRPTARAFAVAWLAAACLLEAAAPPSTSSRGLVARAALLALVPLPGLWVTLTAYADLDAAGAYAMVGRVLSAATLHVAILELLGRRRWRPSRFLRALPLSALGPLCFAFLLWNASLLLPAGLAAFAAGLVALQRVRRAYG